MNFGLSLDQLTYNPNAMTELIFLLLGTAIGYLIRYVQNRINNNSNGAPVSGSGSSADNSNPQVK